MLFECRVDLDRCVEILPVVEGEVLHGIKPLFGGVLSVVFDQEGHELLTVVNWVFLLLTALLPPLDKLKNAELLVLLLGYLGDVLCEDLLLKRNKL